MIASLASLASRMRPWSLLALSLPMLAAMIAPCLAQEAQGAEAAASDAKASSFRFFADNDATLAEHYPTLRALVVARGNCVVFEYYRKDINAETLSPVYSVAKSALDILVGIAIDRGYLRLDQKLSELLPETVDDDVDPRVRQVTIRDLLTMTAGFDPSEGRAYASKIRVPATEAWRWMLDSPMKYQPGTRFNYDHLEPDLLSVVLTRAIKQDAATFAQRNLFGPLDIKNYSWVSDADGYMEGATSLSLTARDMAKIGALYLQHGRWGDKQIVSEDFVRDSTAKHNEGGPPVHAAYGYFWWVTSKADPDAFFAAGRNSQLIYVVPKRDLVAAVAAESLPGGSVSFANNVVLPAEGAMPPSAPCVAQLGSGSSY
jgi:CubicO group peptidase (beta-lactamase class C family)